MSIPPFLSSTPPPPDKCEERDQEEYDIHYNLSQDDDSEEIQPNIHTPSFSNYQNTKYNIPDLNVDNILNSINSEFTESQPVRTDIVNNLEIFNQDDTSQSNSDSIVEDLQLKVEKNYASDNSFEDAKENSCTVDAANTNSDVSSVDSSPIKEHDSTEIAHDNKYSTPKIVLDELSDIETFQIATNLNLEEEVMHDLGFTSESKDVEIKIDNGKTENSLTDNGESSDFNCFKDFNFSNSVINDNSASDSEFNISDVKLDDFNISDEAKIDNNTLSNVFSDVRFEDFEFSNNVNIEHIKPNGLENSFDFNFDDLKSSQEVATENSVVAASLDNLQYSAVEKPISTSNIADTSDDFGFFSNLTKSTSKLHTNIKDEVDSKSENEISGMLSDDDDFGDFDAFRSSEIKVNKRVIIEDQLHMENQPSFDTFQADFNPKTDDMEEDFDDFEDFKTSTHENCNDLNVSNIESLMKEVFEDKDLETGEKYVGLQLESHLSTTWHCLRDIDARQPYILNWNRSNAQQFLLKSLRISMTDVMSMPKLNPNMPRYASNLSTAPLQPMKSQPSVLGVGDGCADSIQMKTVDAAQSYPVQQQTVAESEPAPDIKTIQSAVLQPTARQISLPETHIFTPINSNTPQSQTVIHDSVIKNDICDDEFQDFQSTIINRSTKVSNQQEIKMEDKGLQPTPIFASGLNTLLQPVKVETSLPTLNWPEPGNVKTTEFFDDFTDFESGNKTVDSAPQSQISVIKEVILDSKEDLSKNTSVTPLEVKKPEKITTNVNHIVPLEVKQSEKTATNVNFVAPLKVKKPTTNLNHNDIDSDFDNFQFAPLPSQPVKFHLNGLTNSIPVRQPFHNLLELKPTKVDYSLPPQSNKPQQILQPLSLEGYSSINWPSPGLDLQDLSRFNPLNVLPSMSTASSSNSKNNSPQHQNKKQLDEDWGDFVSTVPNSNSSNVMSSNVMSQDDSDDWSDFVSSVPKPNGINTISFNVSSSSSQKVPSKNIVDIPKMNFVTPKSIASSKRVQKNNLFENL